MNETTSRRRLIQTTGLAALVTGLLGEAGTAAQGQLAPADDRLTQTPNVGPVTNVADLSADVERRVARANLSYAAADRAEEALKATLNAEQRALLEALADAYDDRQWDAEKLLVAGIALHLPGLAGAIWTVYQHTIEESSARCCLPDTAEAAS
jgi:hypothetical protein